MINVTQTFLPPLEDYVAYLEKIWASKLLTNRGELVRKMEADLREYLGVKHLLAVNNGTVALQIAIKALDLTGEIITTPFSYVATVSSIVWENCAPVFVDIDPDFLTIDETRIEAAITPRTSAILATHVYGNPCNVEVIKEIAERHDLKVIYDAAHCFGVKYKGKSILNWGDISTLSFHATKLFHTGEGGAIVCADDELAHKISYMHNFGHNGPEEFFGLGINGKISELNAAMGLCVLPHVDELVSIRRRLFELYNVLLDDERLKKIVFREETEQTYTYYPIIFPSEAVLLKVKSALDRRNIHPRRYFYPSLDKLPYVSAEKLETVDDTSRRILCLPLSTQLTDADVEEICRVIKENL